MTKMYYNLPVKPNAMRGLIVAVTLGAGALAAQEAALKTASLESHEGLTVSAQPWTDARQYKEKFPKKSPFSAGVLAIQVGFRNDSDESLRVNLSRIRLTVHLDADNTQELPSLSAEEVASVVLQPQAKDPTATRKKIPLPIPTPKSGGKNKDVAELQREAEEAGVPTSVIAPHSTVQGLLYFDLQKQFDLLDTARLYVPEITQMKRNHGLTYFEINLGRQSSQ